MRLILSFIAALILVSCISAEEKGLPFSVSTTTSLNPAEAKITLSV